jgi:hypothetical protein
MAGEHPDYEAGDLLVCIDDSLNPLGVCLVVKGNLYRCAAVIVDEPNAPQDAFHGPWATLIVGFPNNYAFAPWRFKKVEPADDQFTSWIRTLQREDVMEPC